MIIKNLEELKLELQKVLIDKGFIDFCQKCPIERCCKHQRPLCDYVIQNIDCASDKGKVSSHKLLSCHFYVCPVMNEKNKEVGNWLQRVRVSITWPNKLEFPIEIEEFKGIESETHN